MEQVFFIADFHLGEHIMVTKVKAGYEKYLFIDYSSTIPGDFKPIFSIIHFLRAFFIMSCSCSSVTIRRKKE